MRSAPAEERGVLFLATLAILLVAWRRRGTPDRTPLESIRASVRVAGGPTVAQCASLALIAVGARLALAIGSGSADPAARAAT